ncbi:hypothetical protein HanPI659440_Chr02g0035641 [Helianthus annuus]|nr:hypothetical protein HanPI659440_Chr02g0035641 [Helianthus annuus]
MRMVSLLSPVDQRKLGEEPGGYGLNVIVVVSTRVQQHLEKLEAKKPVARFTCWLSETTRMKPVPDGSDAAGHCQKLRRMHVGSHASIDWDAMDEIAETSRVRRFIPEEIETEIYTAGLVVVEKPTLVGFWQVIAGADHWEHEKSKGRVSFVRDPLYRYLHHLLATSISARGYSREWCTTTDLFFLYCLLYRRPCALAHGLAQYYASAHHRQERGFLYGGAYVTVIARSLGLVPHQDPHLRTPAIMPTRMGMPSLWGMRVIKRFPVGPRFKNRKGGVWIEEALPEHFEPVHPPADPADVVPVEDPPEDLDGAAVPQPPPPAGAPQFPRHVIRGHAPGAALHPDVRAELDRLNDLVGWLVRAEQDRREREGLPPIPLPPVRAPHQQHQPQQQHQDSDSDLDA